MGGHVQVGGGDVGVGVVGGGVLGSAAEEDNFVV